MLALDAPAAACHRGRMADDISIQHHIGSLIEEERGAAERPAGRSISLDEEHDRLRRLEVELDQRWDLLRQRRAKREFGRP